MKKIEVSLLMVFFFATINALPQPQGKKWKPDLGLAGWLLAFN